MSADLPDNLAAILEETADRSVITVGHRKLEVSSEARESIANRVKSYEDTLRTEAAMDCAKTESGVIDAENVERAQRDLAGHSPGAFWLVLDVIASVMVAVGVTLLATDGWALGLFIGVIGLALSIAAKLATHTSQHKIRAILGSGKKR